MTTNLTKLHPQSLKLLASKLAVMLETRLWLKIITGLLLGLIFGAFLSPSGSLGKIAAAHSLDLDVFLNWLALPGRLFLKVIQMVIIPLILASIIKGLASATSEEQMKRLGFRFSIYIGLSSVLSALLAVGIGILLQPGKGMNFKVESLGVGGEGDSGFQIGQFTPDFILNLIPLNPLQSIVQGQMLEVVFIAVICGVALLAIDVELSRIILKLLDGIQSLCMTIIAWAMKLAPYAVFGMITQVSATTGLSSLLGVGKYILATYLGFIIVISAYLLVVFVFRRKQFRNFVRHIPTPLLIAFSTSSSAATMPITMKTAEEDLKTDPSTTRFLIPMGTTINMAGTAVWQTSAVLFISQVYGMDLSMGQLLFVVATAVTSAIGSPGVPGVGIGILSVVLGKLGVPIEGIGLILGVDRIVDMGCTVVNVAGDLTACQVFGAEKQ